MTPGSIVAVVTCRNFGRLLLHAIDSVGRQSRAAAEIVVVDDRSTDIYTRQALAQLRNTGVRVIEGPGLGASAARNLGIRLTTADYIVCVDGDDTLEPGYFEAAASRLDADQTLDFVSCAMRAFEGANYVWSPSPPSFVEAVATGGVPHASTMLRRGVWEMVGGFDEGLKSFELLDFWASAIERGCRGLILDEPLLNYRVRRGSGYRRSIQADTYLSRLRHLYDKHRESVERHGLALIERKEKFLVDQQEYARSLESKVSSLEGQLAQLHNEIANAVAELESRGQQRVDWGDLERVRPLSQFWGRDRGGRPVDRRYIETFLGSHRTDIRGKVLEVRDAAYTRAFGGTAVEISDVIDSDVENDFATITGDLRRADAIRSDTYDCIILTQALQLIDDLPAVLAECKRILRPGGVLLATAPSIIRVDDEGGVDGDYWRLTEASARKLLAAVFPIDAFDVTPYGNVKTAAAFLYGLAAEEIGPADFEHIDPNFPVVIAVRAVKPQTPVQAPTTSFVAGSNRTGAGVILAYHRISDLTPDAHGLCTPADVFRDHMAFVSRECRPIGLEELIRAAAAGRIPDRAVAVTFDDGYIDALTTASPLLSEFGAPATFFVNTDRLDEEHERWWDLLERTFSGDGVPPVLDLQISGQRIDMPTETGPQRACALQRLNELAWPMDAHSRMALLRQVLEWSGRGDSPRASHRVLTGDEIQALQRRPGHTIGAHTINHLALTTQPADAKRREIVEDKATLERLLGRPVHLFSYPYGDVGDLPPIVGEAGFHAAVTVEPRPVLSGVNRLLAPRYEVTAADRVGFPDRLRALFETVGAQV